MLRLLKIEWMKVKNYRTFWILSILFLVSLFGVNYIALFIQNHAVEKVTDANGKMVVNALIGNEFTFPDVWQTVAWTSGLLLFIPGLLIIISITNEFSFKTHRQNIIDGLSRTQFILVKMLLALIVSIVSTLAVFVIAFLFGISQSGSCISFDKVENIAYFFVQALSYTSLALLFGLLFKRSGIAIGVFFLYVIVLEHMLQGFLDTYLPPIGNYLPLSSGNGLISFPFLRKVANQIITPPQIPYLLIASFIYFAAYYFACKRKFETDDL